MVAGVEMAVRDWQAVALPVRDQIEVAASRWPVWWWLLLCVTSMASGAAVAGWLA